MGCSFLAGPGENACATGFRSDQTNERGSSDNQPIEFQGAWQVLKDRPSAGPAGRRLLFNNTEYGVIAVNNNAVNNERR